MSTAGQAAQPQAVGRSIIAYMITREEIFNLYANNLSEVKKNPLVRFTPDVTDVVICPQCFKIISREEVNNPNGQFSLEHVPSESLGGKIRTFTCRDCNNWSGSNLESHLLNQLHLLDFVRKKPGASVDGVAIFDQDTKVPVDLSYTEGGVLTLASDKKRSDPKSFDAVEKLFASTPPQFTLQFKGKRGRGFIKRRPEAALLRMAYLYAFSIFGYGYLLCSGSKILRSQFRRPSETILPAWGISSDPSIPNEILGLNLVTDPIELQSYMLVLDLSYPHNTVRYAILIPGPSTPGADIYKYLIKNNDRPLSTELKLLHLPDEVYIGQQGKAFAFQGMWKELIIGRTK